MQRLTDQGHVRDQNPPNLAPGERLSRTDVLKLEASGRPCFIVGEREVDLCQVPRGIGQTESGMRVPAILERVADPAQHAIRPLALAFQLQALRVDLVEVVVDEKAVGSIRFLRDQLVDLGVEAGRGESNVVPR